MLMVLLLAGIYMFRVINMKKYSINFLLLLIIASPSNILGNTENDIKILQGKLLVQKSALNPLSGVDIFLDKKVNFKNELLDLNNTDNSANKLSGSSSDRTFTLNKGEFIQIQGTDKITMLFDGSIIIKFNSVPNLSDYAFSKEIEFISDLSNIKRGIFKINNLYDLQMKINEIALDKNVVDIELNLFDSRLKTE